MHKPLEAEPDTGYCSDCGGPTRVLESRRSTRRRECKTCGARFSTIEISAQQFRDLQRAQRQIRVIVTYLKIEAKLATKFATITTYLKKELEDDGREKG